MPPPGTSPRPWGPGAKVLKQSLRNQGVVSETTLPAGGKDQGGFPGAEALCQFLEGCRRPRARRRVVWPWIAGLGILAFLAGTGAFFVRWSYPPTANQNQDDEDKGKADAQVPTVRTVVAPDVTKLGKLRREFGVKIQLLGGTPGPGGGGLMVEGTKVSFQIETERDAYIGIWDIDADGSIMQLFPNEFHSNNLVRASTVFTLPGKPDPGKMNYEFDTNPSMGLDHYWVLASTHSWEGLEAKYEGPFKVFRTAEAKEQWRRNPRGTRVKPVAAGPETEEAISEEVFPYRVRAK